MTKTKVLFFPPAKYLVNLASQVAQWSRIHMPSRSRGFDPWVGKIP